MVLGQGGTHHVPNRGDSFTTKSEYYGHGKMMVGDGTTLPITHVGKMDLTHAGFPLRLYA